MRVLLSGIELGLGHVHRIMRLARRLEERGNEVFLTAGGTAFTLISRSFIGAYPSTPVRWYEDGRGLDVYASLVNIMAPLPHLDLERGEFGFKMPVVAEALRRYIDLMGIVKGVRPDVIVSDGDLVALYLAHRLGVPSVYVTNVIFPYGPYLKYLAPAGGLVIRYIKSSSRIAIPDIPPPYTICEYNLRGMSEYRLSEKASFVGSLVSQDNEYQDGGEDYVFVSINGPAGTRIRLKNTIIPVLRRMSVKSVVSLGEPQESWSSTVGNMRIHSWLSPGERASYMARAKYVIFSGGHNTCFETIMHSKPSVIVPTQSEQLGNARKMSELGCSIVARDGKSLGQAILEMERELDRYSERARRLNRIAREVNGVENAVEIIESVARK